MCNIDMDFDWPISMKTHFPLTTNIYVVEILFNLYEAR